MPEDDNFKRNGGNGPLKDLIEGKLLPAVLVFDSFIDQICREDDSCESH